MNNESLSQLRSFNQKIEGPNLQTVKEVVSRMGAMQAQDFNMAKWAIGIRMQDSTEEMINREIDKGTIVRTHLLRPTWHIVSSEDIHWILELSAPQIRTAAGYRDVQLGLTKSIFRKTNSIIEKVLRDNNHMTREEIISELVKAKIQVDNNRASHILMRAEVDGIICSGKQKDGKSTYAILDEWIPVDNKKKYRDEALKELGLRYFISRGPATTEDFSWWSGLSVKDSRIALELNRTELISELFENRTYWFSDSSTGEKSIQNSIHLLPAYDEFLISYRYRECSLSHLDKTHVVSSNGIFYPTVMMNGQVIGTWKRNINKDKATLAIRMFSKGEKNIFKLSDKSVARYSKFINKKIDLTGN